MFYKTFPPSHDLSKFIKFFWVLELDAQTDYSKKERIFPDACVELIFHYGDLFKKHKNGNVILQPRSFIHGQIKSFIEIEATGRTGMIGVRFFPNGLYPFLKLNHGLLVGENLSVLEVWGSEGEELEDKILNSSNIESRIQLLESFFLDKIKFNSYEYSHVDNALKIMYSQKGSISISELSNSVNLSKRHFERKFKEEVGLSPKSISRIIRFQQVLKELEQNKFVSLTKTAHDFSYHDQAHFIHDFKLITGENPKSYFAKHQHLAKYFNT